MVCIPHDYKVIKKTWQDYARSSAYAGATLTTLDHSQEILVCSKCGDILDPWIAKDNKK